MSASKKKQLRQNAEPSKQEVLAKEQAAAYKKKVRTYTIIGIVVVVLVAALLIWNSGLFQRNQTAATVGDTKYTVNDVNYYYQAARYNAFYLYSYLGYEYPSDDEVMDTESGQTYREYFLETSLDNLTELTALYDAAVQAGYSASDVADAVKEQIQSTKQYAAQQGYGYKAFLKLQFGRFMTPAAYKEILTKTSVVDAYYSDHAETLEYSDEALNLYYEENKAELDTYDYSYLYFTPAEVTANEDVAEEMVAELEAAALADAKLNAEAALAELEGGADIAALSETYADAASYTSHSKVVGSSLSSVFGEELKAAEVGKAFLVENGETGFYVMILHDRALSDSHSVDVRHILVNAAYTMDADGKRIAPTPAEWSKTLTKIEEIQAEYQNGEQTAEAFGALAEKYSEDSGSNTAGGLYEAIPQGQFVEEFDKWLFEEEHEVGDIGIIKHEAGEDDSNVYYGYHLAYYAGETLTWKLTAESALQSADITEWVNGLKAGYTGEYTSAAKYVAE